MPDEESTIGVFFGSRTPEHDVSIITADLVMSGLEELGYEVVPIYISKDGQWYIDERMSDISFFKEDGLKDRLAQLKDYSLDLQRSQEQMVFVSKKGFLSSNEITIDIAFPAFHGTHGEDGSAQGLFELCNIPYVGSGISASNLAMDKVLTKLFYQRFRIPTTDFTYLMKKEWNEFKDDIIDQAEALGYPLFVKPARAGSSIGISRVEEKEQLEFSIETALHYDNKVLIEKAVEDVADVTVALLGNEDPETSLIQESIFEDNFFSYEDKYLNEGGAQLGNADKNIEIPADLDDEVAEHITDTAADIYRLFECAGTARVDFLYDREEEIAYANEVNTMPGTLYHHLWKESGVSLSELLERLLDLAEDRHQKQQDLTHTFDSDILAHANEDKGAKLDTSSATDSEKPKTDNDNEGEDKEEDETQDGEEDETNS